MGLQTKGVTRMSTTALKRLEALQKCNADPAWVNADLYRLLYKDDFHVVAYEKIKSAPGNMTPGTDGATLDGFSQQVVRDLVSALRDESFQFKPSRREYIPKANGKMRPLGIPSPRDKIVQEVIRMILDAIYDSPKGATFRDGSHGFRTGRGTHTALREFRTKWSGVTWIIEGDIKSCFDEIDHHVLISLLRKRISDERFIGLIWKALRAGYLWRKERRDSVVGTPQGSVCSPILANVYLHELDLFVEELRKKYEKGKVRKGNPAYSTVNCRRQRALTRTGGVMTSEIRDLTRQMRSLPSKDPCDPDFVRIKYIRYADDWIIGVTGPRSLAEQIKDEIQTFLRGVLKLELSHEKTVITHAKTEEAFFLGTRLRVGAVNSNPKITRSNNGTRQFKLRCTGWNPLMRAPTRRLVERLHQKGFCDGNGVGRSKSDWVGLEVDYIINLFNSVNQGLLNYYRFADNFASLSRIQYILHMSLAKTLAHKLRTPVKQIFCEHGRSLEFCREGREGQVRRTCFKLNSDWTRNPTAFMTGQEPPDPLERFARLRSRSCFGLPCITCGAKVGVQMHHVRHLRKVGGKPANGFAWLMRQQNRKQVPVCEQCHRKIHRGEYDGLRLADLAYQLGP